MTPPVPVVFAFEDPGRRTWVAVSRDGSYNHLVHPVDAHDLRVERGVRRVSELTCECTGGRVHGTCYVVAAAEARERAAQREVAKAEDRQFLAATAAQARGEPDPFAPFERERTWLDGPPGEVAEAFGK